jgi:hypothetical protein
MITLGVTCITFIFSVLVHIFLFKTVNIFKKNLFPVTCLMFLLAGSINFACISQISRTIPLTTSMDYILYSSLPITSTILFIISSIVFIQYVSGIMTHESSPSVKIYSLLSRKNHTYIQLKHHFTTYELIEHRLNTLVHMGIIMKHKTHYVINTKGKILYLFISFYKEFLGWHSNG